MPRTGRPRKQRDKYAQRVAELYEQNTEKPTIREITRTINEEANEKVISEGTVRRILDEHRERPDGWLEMPVLWPYSMVMGYLPWEASEPVLHLLHYCHEDRWNRPTNRQTLWYWRIRLACPSLSVEQALSIGAIYSNREYNGFGELPWIDAWEPALARVAFERAQPAEIGESSVGLHLIQEALDRVSPWISTLLRTDVPVDAAIPGGKGTLTASVGIAEQESK